MPVQTVAEKVLRRIRASKGSVWSAGEFADLGSRSALDQALRRLWLAGTIRKVARGLYDYPQKGGASASELHALTGQRRLRCGAAAPRFDRVGAWPPMRLASPRRCQPASST